MATTAAPFGARPVSTTSASGSLMVKFSILKSLVVMQLLFLMAIL